MYKFQDILYPLYKKIRIFFKKIIQDKTRFMNLFIVPQISIGIFVIDSVNYDINNYDINNYDINNY